MVTRVDLVPDTVELVRFKVACDQRRLPGPGRTDHPYRWAVAVFVQHREQPLANTHVV